jgi:hypothetical protein
MTGIHHSENCVIFTNFYKAVISQTRRLTYNGSTVSLKKTKKTISFGSTVGFSNYE